MAGRGRGIDPTTGKRYTDAAVIPGTSANVEAALGRPTDAAVGTMRREADALYGPELKNAENDLYKAANAINPTAARDDLMARAGQERQATMNRVARMRALGTAASQAPSVEQARTDLMQSDASTARRAALAGGRGLLEKRNAFGAAANTDAAIIGDASRRQAGEGVRDIAERGQYAMGGGQMLSQGAATGTGLIGTAGDTERTANIGQSQLADSATDLFRRKHSTRADILQKAGNMQLDDSRRRGVSSANLQGVVSREAAATDAYQKSMQDIEDAKTGDLYRQIGTTGMGMATGFLFSDRRTKRRIRRMEY